MTASPLRRIALLLAPAAIVGGTAALVPHHAPPLHRLKVDKGSGTPAEIALPPAGQATITLGRAPGNTIVFTERTVSRQHATVTCAAGACTVTDTGTEGTGSLNGTFLNGKQLKPNTPSALKGGDTIGLGPDVQLSLH